MQIAVIVALVVALVAIAYFARKYILSVAKKSEQKIAIFVVDHIVSPVIGHLAARVDAIEKTLNEKFPPSVH